MANFRRLGANGSTAPSGTPPAFCDPAGLASDASCINTPPHCGWQVIGATQVVAAGTAAGITVVPQFTPFFQPKAVSMIVFGVADPTLNFRVLVGTATVGGSPVNGLNIPVALGAAGAASNQSVVVSDIFTIFCCPIYVDWPCISNAGNSRELIINVFSPAGNGVDVAVTIAVFGDSLQTFA